MINILIYELFAKKFISNGKNGNDNYNMDIIVGQIKDFINICLSAFVF
jgi:hypothetical protein